MLVRLLISWGRELSRRPRLHLDVSNGHLTALDALLLRGDRDETRVRVLRQLRALRVAQVVVEEERVVARLSHFVSEFRQDVLVHELGALELLAAQWTQPFALIDLLRVVRDKALYLRLRVLQAELLRLFRREALFQVHQSAQASRQRGVQRLHLTALERWESNAGWRARRTRDSCLVGFAAVGGRGQRQSRPHVYDAATVGQLVLLRVLGGRVQVDRMNDAQVKKHAIQNLCTGRRKRTNF